MAFSYAAIGEIYIVFSPNKYFTPRLNHLVYGYYAISCRVMAKQTTGIWQGCLLIFSTLLALNLVLLLCSARDAETAYHYNLQCVQLRGEFSLVKSGQPKKERWSSAPAISAVGIHRARFCFYQLILVFYHLLICRGSVVHILSPNGFCFHLRGRVTVSFLTWILILSWWLSKLVLYHLFENFPRINGLRG